ncbi:MAG: PAS domain S-box protein [Deltaproteobacteria bacterium]|nr:PAS domain S-box protein [Deltaproteobacteria bacterium]
MTTYNYTFRELVDLEKLEAVFSSFSRATGYTVGLLEQESGELLIKTGWRKICACFHRAHEASAVHCQTSNRRLTGKIGKAGEINIEHCENGLVDACTPVVIGGRHLANLCTGQVFFAPPDPERFRRQAREYGFDEKAYLQAMEQVPVVEVEIFKEHLRFLAHLATTVAEVGLAEIQLRRSEERYRVLFRESQDGVFRVSLKGRFLEINPAGVRIFGYDSEDELKSIDVTTDLYKNPVDRLYYIELMQRQGFVRNHEITMKKKDGSDVIIEVSSTPFMDEAGQVIGFRGIYRDITEKRMMENQLAQIQKMESIGQLAGGIAHDFNNFLTVINGSAEIALLHLGQDEKLIRNLEAILKVGRRAEKLVSQLLAFSRKQIFRPAPLDINRTILGIESMLRRLISEDIRIETILADNLPEIQADVTQIEQIFVNLVVNARDALEALEESGFAKRIIITTDTISLSSDYVGNHPGSGVGEHVCFSVSDNGIGMEAEVRRKIFEPFFTTKPKSRGTGLGLATVYGIVKQNNGSIYVYSEPGKGTTFKVYWPVLQETGSSFRSKRPGKEELRHGLENILVVEDEEEVRNFIREGLQSLGYTVYDAAGGQAALELLRDESLVFELMITDLVMPDLNGRELAFQARELRPDLKVIFTSGYADNYIVHNGMLEEGVNFIQKPYSLQDLGMMVRKVLDGVASG